MSVRPSGTPPPHSITISLVLALSEADVLRLESIINLNSFSLTTSALRVRLQSPLPSGSADDITIDHVEASKSTPSESMFLPDPPPHLSRSWT